MSAHEQNLSETAEAAGVASLGMYDLPWLQAANDRLWVAIRDRLRGAGLSGVPDRLDRARPLDAIWHDPSLLLGQTCGYPLRTRLDGVVRLVATPIYASPFSEGAFHRSAIVVARGAPWRSLEDLRGRVAAVNGFDSNTGMNLFRLAVAPLVQAGGGPPFFGRVVETGAHLESLKAVAQGTADVAAIDGVTYGLVQRHRPDLLDNIAVLTTTRMSPGLPFITAASASDSHVAALQAALDAVAADPTLADVRHELCLTGFERIDAAEYDRVLTYERMAERAGYPVLA
ncbi:phosphate/phosphite/phosphonate ABC transporter substrate-binding protein [Segnochrobactrum spirostomi]|uniref:PhnD/SsuA/transferrin family substrate-binding protein n=1 Tax=Segnochrobactrum spirostomi TaxID=2608987 RepID=A0A6A7Y5B3_9HYPH|nr:PhnD/SsuA/transferrin family substrate-binding protein [Segnochrobactrum spirostomi]MQT13537.1 PhnD/SsuA/transferrin family substrate-binding protein [Segnochrobactrum spirostomi]